MSLGQEVQKQQLESLRDASAMKQRLTVQALSSSGRFSVWLLGFLADTSTAHRKPQENDKAEETELATLEIPFSDPPEPTWPSSHGKARPGMWCCNSRASLCRRYYYC